MFDRLVDRIGKNLYGKTRLRYTDIIDTFRMKYPQVRVVQRMGTDVPVVFLVWRNDDGIYTIDLCPSKKLLYSEVESAGIANHAARLLAKEFAREMAQCNSRLRENKRIAELKQEGAQDYLGHILNWGVFGYDCKEGAGEFCCDGAGFGRTFVDYYVLDEDKYSFDEKRYWDRPRYKD